MPMQSPRTSDPAVIEHRLLDLAYTTDATITTPLLAYYAPCSIQDAERVLDRLVTEDRLQMEVDDDGNIFYVMPGRQKVPEGRVAHAAHTPHALVQQVHPVLEFRPPPNPAAAAVLSLIVPGAGQLYAGRPISAVSWFTLVTLGYMLLIVPGVLLHILCIASAAAAANQWRPSMA
jgi:TM2 domain-containing membrane protein YozV